MKRLESQQVESLTGERSTRYEVILWGAMESEVVDCDSFLEECDAGFVVEVREIWKPLYPNQSNHRQVSQIEVSSRGMAQRIYDYTAETLYCL